MELSPVDRFLSPQSLPPADSTVGVLAAVLTAGVVVGTPVLGLLGRAVGVPLLFGLLAGLGLAGVAYLAVAVYYRQVPAAVVVAVLGLSTVAANLPLTGGATAYPSNLGPQVWLVHPALLALAGVLAYRRDLLRFPVSRVELAFGAFVVWSALGALLGDVPRRDTALYFALFQLTPLVGFALVYRSVRARVVSLRQVVLALVTVTVGHTAFAFAQLVNQQPFGLTFLGEIGRSPLAPRMSLPVVGDFIVGAYVSGLTGGNGPFSVLAVLVLPVLLAAALGDRLPDPWRVACLFAGFAVAFGLRATEKDGSRAAFVLTLLIVAGLYALHRYSLGSSPTPGRRGGLGELPAAVVSGVLSVFVVLFPSSTSGTSSNRDVTPPGVETPEPSTTTSTTTATTSTTTTTPTPEPVFDVTQVSVPFFSLETLGFRAQQYIAGAHMASVHPLFGIGGGNFPYVVPEYGLSARLADGSPFPLHNLYVATLAETGVPGFLLYVGALVGVVVAALKLLRRRPTDALTYGLVGGLVGVLGAVFWTVNLRYTLLVPFWTLAGAVVAAERVGEGPTAGADADGAGTAAADTDGAGTPAADTGTERGETAAADTDADGAGTADDDTGPADDPTGDTTD